MKLKVYINDKYYRTIDDGGKNSNKTYDPAVVMKFISQDKAQGLLDSFEIETKGLSLKVEPTN